MAWSQFEWLKRQISSILSTKFSTLRTDVRAEVDASNSAQSTHVINSLAYDNDVTRDEILNGIPARVPSGVTVTGIIAGRMNTSGTEISYNGKGMLFYYSGSSGTAGGRRVNLDGVEIGTDILGLMTYNLGGPFLFSNSIYLRYDSGGGVIPSIHHHIHNIGSALLERGWRHELGTV